MRVRWTPRSLERSRRASARRGLLTYTGVDRDSPLFVGPSASLILLLAAVIVGCGGGGEAGDEKEAAPKYAATPHRALESWVTAVRAGNKKILAIAVSRLLLPDQLAEFRDFQLAEFRDFVRRELGTSLHLT